ncbi:MAG: hypothetical protein ACREIU_16125, partial [Planctomycetota bacterium]
MVCSGALVPVSGAFLLGLLVSCGKAPLSSVAASLPVQVPSVPSPDFTGLAFPDERQIHWQRSLDDALRISAAESRPILIAVNADGESASERIVRELYRDPKFVALTRRFVCLAASPFRHSPRDFDERGPIVWRAGRAACPRLGEVTCGEHQALEPVLFDRFLGGDRISPRHALLLPTGEKAFDLTLIWDLREVERRLAEAADKAPPSPPAAPLPISTQGFPAGPEERERAWIDLAGRRKHRERLAFEGLIANWATGGDAAALLGALERVGDRGAYPALRAMLVRGAEVLAGSVDRYADLAAGLGLQSEVGTEIWDHLSDPGVMGFPPGPSKPPPPALLRLLARVDGRSARTGSLLLSYLVTSPAEGPLTCEPALRDLLGEEGFASARAAVASEGGPLDLVLFAQAAGLLLPDEPASPPPSPPLPAEETLVRELDEAEQRLRLEPSDPSHLAAAGRASLRLARKRIEGGEKADLLLSDAERFLAQASAAKMADPPLLLDRARTAHHLGKFEEQERLAVEALAALPPLSARPFSRPRGAEPEARSFCGDTGGFLERLRRLRASAAEDAAALALPP